MFVSLLKRFKNSFTTNWFLFWIIVELYECDKKHSDKDPKRRNVNKEPKESNVDKHLKGKNANKNKKIKDVNKNAKKTNPELSTTTTTTTKAMTIETIGISTEMPTETSALVNETPAVTIESNAVQAPTLEMLECYFNCRSRSKLSIDWFFLNLMLDI